MIILHLGSALILGWALVAFAEPVEPPSSQVDSPSSSSAEAAPPSEIPRGGKPLEGKKPKKQKSKPKKAKAPSKELEEEDVPPAPALY